MGKKQDKKQNEDQKPEVSMEDFQKLQTELEEIKGVSLNLDNQLKRAVADYQNLEKRIAEGRVELSIWATSNLIQKILPILSHFDKALESASETEKQSGWFRGIELAVQQLRQVLKDEGLEEIAADGQFDPALHEAVDTKIGEHDKILEVIEKGYNLNGKVVKPAKVVVGKKRDN